MKKTIILELHSFYLDRLINWFQETQFHKKYNILVLVKDYRKEKFKNNLSQFPELHCIGYDDLFSYKSTQNFEISSYHQFCKAFLNNHFTARFLDRAGYYPVYGMGNQNAFSHYTFKAYNVLCFLKENNIDFMCFRNTPHTIEEWLLAQAVEHSNIDFYSLENQIFSWLFTIKKGLLNNASFVFEDLNMLDKDELKAHITKCIKIVSGNYENAIPTYEKNRMGKGYFKYYSPFKYVKDTFKRPHQFIARSKNFWYYKKNSYTFDLKHTKYVIYFMHYQPERSTLPEGLEFVDQFYTVNILSKMLPKGVKLLVKEHPTIFTRISEPKFRTVQNYKMINQLENVSFVKMNTDSFSLIDNALLVCTVNGTASLEAYIRKKPVVTLGKTSLKLPGVYNFSNINSLQDYINKALEGKIQITNVEDNLLASCLKVSASGLTQSAEKTEDYSFTKDIRENATYKILTKFLDYKLN